MNNDKDAKKSAPKAEAPEPKLTLEQKFPKMLYREADDAPTIGVIETVTVGSEEEEAKWKAEGFMDKITPKPKAKA